MGLRIVPEEAKSTVNLAELAKEFGYPLRISLEEGSEIQEKKLQLYAKAAVLLDADSKRILYGKDEDVELPMASTTKIMTCIVALENGRLDDVVTVSSYAASQPEVRLGIRKGEQYVLRDLIYAMMLTSYNDCAVAIAEHIGESAEGFADMMNE
ncbi:MAG: D-alanyl-D-alanine carboxypeptidase, partial [Lachnospiraceae bacterium]|nr:D-alanyl-D-alanine carboxypeptidase [Lachnospiraceae bacterium]